MKMKMRKGFTLVELLIVIVIIGILASAMMLSSGSATDSAEASNIITDMRSLKTACTMLYADSMDTFNNLTAGTAVTYAISVVEKYMDNPSKLGGANSPFSIEINTDGKWYVKFDIDSANTPANRKTPGVKEKLAGRAGSIGLYKEMKAEKGSVFTASDAVVYMVAR